MAIDSAFTGQKLNPAVVQSSQGEQAVRPSHENSLSKRPVEEAAKAEPVDFRKQALIVQEAAGQLSEILKLISSDLNFSVHDEVGQTVIKVIDRENEDVIRQIPSEEVLVLMKRLTDIAEEYRSGPSGLLIQGEA